MKAWIRERLFEFGPLRAVYRTAQEMHFDSGYRKRRERYEERLAGLAQRATVGVASEVRAQLARRGYTPRPRTPGDVHSLAFLPSNWQHQNQMARSLEEIGALSRFDYRERGWALPALRSSQPGRVQRRDEMLRSFLDFARQAHARRPVDWVLCYSLGWDMTPETIRAIQQELGAPIVNVSFDDKNWWDEIERGDRASGLVNIAPHFDLGWTSSRLTTGWYAAHGGRGVFLPEGVNTSWFCPIEVEQDVDVGFVGSRFGYRAEILDALRKAKINVTAMGDKWSGRALTDPEMVTFFSRCRVNLGIGDMHYSRWLTNLKGRDFEAPSSGRGVYVTTYNSDLASAFHVGREIVCYRGVEELIELVRWHLRNREESDAIARAGRERCVKEHQWRHRYESILAMLGVLESQPANPGSPR